MAAANQTWEFDSDDEFFAKYRKPCSEADFSKTARNKDASQAGYLYVSFYSSIKGAWTTVTVTHPTSAKIDQVFEVFERDHEPAKIRRPAPPQPKPVRPTIFIGHGHSAKWRDLKDHLTDKQGYDVTAYEVGARAGHTIRDILQELLVQSSMALLVLTAEDEMTTGEIRPRQNVVHELGLFQGKLGFPRAIAIVEEGTTLLSNIDGVQQIRFGDNIAEVYGDVIATIRREFGDTR